MTLLTSNIRRITSLTVLFYLLGMLCNTLNAQSNTRLLTEQTVIGEWILDIDNNVMINPQTSGLKYHAGFLYSVSDASAAGFQQRKLHKIDMEGAKVVAKIGPTLISNEIQQSCFYEYLNVRPDYEALVPLNDAASEWLFVTEDAREGAQLSEACQKKYMNTHSTLYPSLLVRLVLSGETLIAQSVRPIQFPLESKVGDTANDGIEGLALTHDNRLLLGLEQDSANQPQVFEVQLDDDFWQTQSFVKLASTNLKLPDLGKIDHPINGMDIYYPHEGSEGYLVAAARNQDQLWLIDLSEKRPTKILPLIFVAPSQMRHSALNSPLNANTPQCAPVHEMNNASIEGVAVHGNNVYLVNDPWKANYPKNVVCESDRQRYEAFAPLLFKLTLDPSWFE